MKPQENAVIYVRVSTEEQAGDALNLVNQEKRCRNYCQQKGLTVVEAFIDAGASARSSDRPEFQRMLSYCKAPRNRIRYVVVQYRSRFARNNRDQGDAIFQLERSGVSLRSTYESNIDETAGESWRRTSSNRSINSSLIPTPRSSGTGSVWLSQVVAFHGVHRSDT
jgi:DNA invertase Pin-like site-specific DNA recombinase